MPASAMATRAVRMLSAVTDRCILEVGLGRWNVLDRKAAILQGAIVIYSAKRRGKHGQLIAAACEETESTSIDTLTLLAQSNALSQRQLHLLGCMFDQSFTFTISIHCYLRLQTFTLPYELSEICDSVVALLRRYRCRSLCWF